MIICTAVVTITVSHPRMSSQNQISTEVEAKFDIGMY